ncbi:receptor-type tyrosine-protein phosphatase C isoform X3 [Xenopus laevis]|uniref:Receptor-type tyrosine-protein phosphatase C n=1 Tax=Xenopus laevis TaxID=8355 RepID=A0A8J1KJK2_XENLA|nr:receptor-type tyrosine-protein phosphatase C isoform X3 [Xenopus laevis]
MVLYLNSLMVLFLLQFQNCMAEEKKDITPSSSPILNQTPPSATITALTINSTQSDFQSYSSDGLIAPPFSTSKDLLLASTSSAVSSTLTPTSTDNLSSSTGDSQESPSSTHAPTYTNKEDLSPAPNSSADSTARMPSYQGSTISGLLNTSDFHTTISPTTNFFTSPSHIGETDINCSEIKHKIVFNPGNNRVSSGIVTIENIPKVAENLTLNCTDIGTSQDIMISQDTPYAFNFTKPQCTKLSVMCDFINKSCSTPFSFTEMIPLNYRNFNLSVYEGQNSIRFEWDGKELLNTCHVKENYTCIEQNNPTEEYRQDDQTRKVTNLKPYTEYICTAMLTYNGTVINTTNITTQTKAAKPGPIRNLYCKPSNTSIYVTWEAPEERNGPLSGYILSRQLDSEKDNVTLQKKHHHTFKNLEPYKNYTVCVKAFNREQNITLYGEGKNIKCNTTEGVPDKVTIVSTTFEGNNIIRIKCHLQKEKLKGPKARFQLEFHGGKPKKHEECDFQISDLNYLTTYTFKINVFNGVFSGPSQIVTVTTKYNDKALIGFLVFFIVITTLALLLVLIKIYKLQRGSSRQCEILPLVNQDDEKQLMNIDPIPVELLLDTYKKKNADEGRLFLDEFQSIPRVFSKFSIKEARKSCNQTKNRYIDILPYDDNRVVLSEIQGELGSDYINASHVNGFKEPRKYIAAQGPKDETIYDFWRMVWEQKSTIIVMVTRCEEGKRNKCAQYWPSLEDESATYNEIVVKITEEKIFPDYITRKLHINNERERSERDVTHIQFTVWPDHGVPDEPNLLLKLRRRVNALSNFFSGPIIVHCSAGVGRTGTYMSIDAMLEGLEAENRVNVYGYVVQLRRQRCLMVQVESQYIFIHKCLVEYSQFGETEISIPELPHSLNNLKTRDPPSEPSQLESEFQRLPSYRNWRLQKAGIDQNNKDMNRNPKIVPYDFNRVQIKLEEEQPSEENGEDSEYSSDEGETEDDTKYINASYIIGYWGTRAIIATQGPLGNTMPDFWQMIFQKKVKAIVTLSAPSQENKEAACFPYWEKKKETYEDLEVELTNEKSCGSYTERTFEITHSKKTDKRTVCQFHYEQWVEELPGNFKELLNMIEKIRKTYPDKRVEESSKHDKSASLVVHCSDGSQQTGTFCALWNLLESAHTEGVIDVFQTVKNIRKQRPGMVSSLEHYQFLYDIIASTVPAQNGQIKTPIRQEDTVEIHNELAMKAPVVKESEKDAVQQEEEVETKPKVDESTSNGPTAAPFTEMTLRIDE